MDIGYIVILGVILFALAYMWFISIFNGDWGVLPLPIRIILVPLYIFACLIAIVLIFEILQFPSIGVIVFTCLLYIVSLVTDIHVNAPFLYYIIKIIADIVGSIGLIIPYYFAIIIPEFKKDHRKTFNYRMVIGGALFLLLEYVFIADETDSVHGIDRYVYAVIILLFTYFVYSTLRNELPKNK